MDRIELQARVSKGNIKLGGNIPNINLSPVRTCQGLPCLKEGCYAMKAYNLHPSVRKAWNDNYWQMESSSRDFFDSIIKKLQGKRTPFSRVRWHSAGEIPEDKMQTYFSGMVRVAKALPGVKFLCFTKRYSLDTKGCPDNLQIIFSSWPGLRMNNVASLRKKGGVAWMDDGNQKRRIKEEGKKPRPCTGDCRKCSLCWNLKKTGNDVIFKKH
jgi:hypothetical protein